MKSAMLGAFRDKQEKTRDEFLDLFDAPKQRI